MFVCRCSGRFNRFSGVYSHCSSLPGRNKHSDCVTLQVSRQLTQNVEIKLKKLSISLKRNRFDIVWFWSLRFLRQKTESKHLHVNQVGVTFRLTVTLLHVLSVWCTFLFYSLLSAGVGRTGVLIFMESAFNMIESAEPIYPLEIVRKMRDQRCSLIQTPVSWDCVTVLKSFHHYRATEPKLTNRIIANE